MPCNIMQDHLDSCNMIWVGGKWGTSCLDEVNTNTSSHDSLINQQMINKFRSMITIFNTFLAQFVMITD